MNFKMMITLVALVVVFAGCSAKQTHDKTAGGKDEPSKTQETMPDKAGEAVKDAAEGTGDAMKDMGDGAGDAVKDVTDGVGDAVKDAGNGIKNAVDGK